MAMLPGYEGGGGGRIGGEGGEEEEEEEEERRSVHCVCAVYFTDVFLERGFCGIRTKAVVVASSGSYQQTMPSQTVRCEKSRRT